MGRKRAGGGDNQKETMWAAIYYFGNRQDAEVMVGRSKADALHLAVRFILDHLLVAVKNAEVRKAIKAYAVAKEYEAAVSAWKAWQADHADFPDDMQVKEVEVYGNAA